MRRLKNLDVMEVSLVKAGANGKKYAIVKNKQGAAMAVDESALLDLFQRIPKARIEAIQAVAKSAKARVRKADDLEDGVAPSDAPQAGDQVDETGLSENAQNAIKAAGRILAPYSEELNRGVMDALGDALDLEDDAEDDAEDAEDVAEDAVDKSDEDAKDQDAVEKDEGDTEDDVTKADDEEAGNTESPLKNELEEATAKADDGAEVDNSDDETKGDKAEDIDKADDDALAADMPDFAETDDADKNEALAAARAAYADVMKRKTAKSKAQKDADGPGVGSDKVTEEKDVTKSAAAVAKSVLGNLKGFSKSQQAGLSQVLKSQFARMAELEQAHKEAVAKSAKLQQNLLRREFIAKAASDYAALGNATALGEQMLRLHLKDPEGLKSWEAVLKTANAAAQAGGEAGLFGELGSRMASAGIGDADAKIQAHVDSVVQKSGATKSREQITAEFLDTPAGRALYTQSRQQAEKGKR